MRLLPCADASGRSYVRFHKKFSDLLERRLPLVVPFHHTTGLVGFAQLLDSFFGNAECPKEPIHRLLPLQCRVHLLNSAECAPFHRLWMKGRNFVAMRVNSRRLLAPRVRRAEQFMRFHFVIPLSKTNSRTKGVFERSGWRDPNLNLREASSMSTTLRLEAANGRRRHLAQTKFFLSMGPRACRSQACDFDAQFQSSPGC